MSRGGQERPSVDESLGMDRHNAGARIASEFGEAFVVANIGLIAQPHVGVETGAFGRPIVVDQG